jgi:formate C-acetyltransferase
MTIAELNIPQTVQKSMTGTSPTITRLRDALLDRKPSVCVERARLVTEAYQKYENAPIVMRRARTTDT